jgi:hypothetical protein
MGHPALLPLRRKACCGLHRPWSGLSPRTSGPITSTLAITPPSTTGMYVAPQHWSYKSTRRYNPDDQHWHFHRCDNPISHTVLTKPMVHGLSLEVDICSATQKKLPIFKNPRVYCRSHKNVFPPKPWCLLFGFPI